MLGNLASSVSSQLALALEQCSKVIGCQHVITEPQQLAQYQQNCACPGMFASAILRPGSVEELKELLLIAKQSNLRLFPISAGKNWGYGSRSPSTPNNIIVELKRLNRIIEVNVDLAYAVVEPGVTQQQLYEYLTTHNLPLMMDATGASPHASLIGNLCERGSGLSPYSDHFNHACGLEILLSDGRSLNTGFGHLPECRSKYLYRWGVGPYLDGLFTQSNFGIVTKAALWLMPKPKTQSAILVQFNDDNHLSRCVGRLRDLKLRGVLSGAVHIANDLRVLSSICSYPWDEAQGKTPLPEQLRLKLQKRYGVGGWNLIGGVWGTPQQVRLAIRNVRKSLSGHASVTVVSEHAVNLLSRFRTIYRLFGGVGLEQKLSILRLLKGIPSFAPQRGAYWRKRVTPDLKTADPDRDGCGLIWFSPIAPLMEKDISELLSIIRTCCASWGFETNLTVSLINERAAVCPIAILFDSTIDEERYRAIACHEQLIKSCVEAGFPPYRLGTHIASYQGSVYRNDDVFWDVCSQIKTCLDPSGIIAPGRYVP